MWVTPLNIVTLLSMLAALGYVASEARKLDGNLGALLRDQQESRHLIEGELNRLRQSAAAMENG